jgi:hypothetical protein
MVNLRRYFQTVFSIVISWQFVLTAQDVTGRIEGRIVDESGSAIPGVEINVSSPNLPGTRFSQTNAEGYFRLILLPPGFYTAKITHIAYSPLTIDSIQVRLGRSTFTGEIVLEEKPYEMEEIIVEDRRNLIDNTSTVTGGNFTKDEIEPLPLQRNMQYIPLLLPQVNISYYGDEFSYSGATGRENRYLIDGVDVTEPQSFNGGIIIPYNFIKDIEVISGGYEAQYRSALGGIVNVLTPSGGDKISGQVFGFYTSKRFTANPRTVPGSAPDDGFFSLYDFGINIGGPLIKEKLWLNAAYNPNFQNEEVLVPGIGNETEKQLSHLIAGKLSWHLSGKAQLIFNFSGSFFNTDGVSGSVPSGLETYSIPDPALYKLNRNQYSPSITGVYSFSDKFFIEGSISRYELNLSYGPGTETGNQPIFYDYENGTISGGMGETQNNITVRYSSNLKATLFLKDHTVKTGIEYFDISLDVSRDLHRYSKFSDSLFYYYISSYSGKVGNRIPAAFIQDSWKINNSWQINAGLRWEGQYIISSDRKVAQKILNQFQPRVGVIFLPYQNGDQKIFASYGRFYQELADAPINYYYLGELEDIFRSYNHDPRQDPSGGDTLNIFSSQIQQEIQGFRGQYDDEYSLGYESKIFNDFKFSIQGVYRKLGEGIEDGYSNEWQKFALGNPGSYPLSEYPNLKRNYMALEIVFQKVSGDPFNFSVSYVLSRNYGNYEGLFDSETRGRFAPNITSSFEYPETVVNATGLLPLDRTHVFKIYGSYRFNFGLNVGTVFSWMSGTPLNEYGVGPESLSRIFLQPRGTVGRTPEVWDLNFRLTYLLPQISYLDYQARLILDVFHVASTRAAVTYDQIHYLNVDEYGNQIYPNPTYGEPTSYQPPMSIRFGFEVNF